jgi:hypothetical protein
LRYIQTQEHQEARQVGILGVRRRTLVLLLPAVSPLLARTAQHAGLKYAKKIKDTVIQCSDCFFGLARTSATPCFHAICSAFKQEILMEHREQENLRGGEKKGGDGRDSTLKTWAS